MLLDRDNKPILFAVVATGVSSVVTQLLLIREFLALFHGNEFVIALILSSWLLLGGVGAWLARRAADRRPAEARRLGWLSLLLAGFTPVLFFAVRGLRDVFFIHGTSVGFYPTLAYTVCTLAPYCLLVGFLLPYSLFALRAGEPRYPGAFVYMADNLGDVAGGALFSFALVSLVTPLQAVLIANLPLLALGWFLAGAGRRSQARERSCRVWRAGPARSRCPAGKAHAHPERGRTGSLPGIPARPHHGIQKSGAVHPVQQRHCRF